MKSTSTESSESTESSKSTESTKSVKIIHNEYANDKFTLNVVDGSLKTLSFNNKTFNIGKVLGKSNAIVWNIDSGRIALNASQTFNTPICLKISEGGKTELDDEKIKYINAHSKDFTRIYYFFPNVRFDSTVVLEDKKFKTLDICILEKVDATVEDSCNYIMNYNYSYSPSITFSYNFINKVSNRLLEIIGSLVRSGYYYTDLKPANIGVVEIDNHYDFKLIDVDSIFKERYDMINTLYTSGSINNNISLMRIQYLNIMFTIISLLFNDDGTTMCSKDYGQFRIEDKMYSYMKWFNKKTRCGEYKYTLLIGTYMVMAQYFGTSKITVNMIMSSYDNIVDDLNNIITAYRPSGYFRFIAKILISMIVIILMQDEYDLPDAIPLFVNEPPNLPTEPVTEKNTLSEISIQPHVPNGVAIVNYLQYYITQYCKDSNCTPVSLYGDYFSNVQ